MSDKWMTRKTFGLGNLREQLKIRSIQKEYDKKNKKEVLTYSQPKGIYYTVLFSLLLWWIPIAGPAIAGYIGGRKSGSTSKALASSLIATSVILILTFLLAPFTSGPLSGANTYFGSGVLTLSQSKLFAYSGLLSDLYTGYGIYKTFAIILPGSVVVLNIFSYTGGFMTTLKTQEDHLNYSYMNQNIDDQLRSVRSAPKVNVGRRVIKEFTDGSNDEDEGIGGWSYL